jgi:hypothetical protein
MRRINLSALEDDQPGAAAIIERSRDGGAALHFVRTDIAVVTPMEEPR